MRHEVLGRRHFPPFLDPDEVLHRVQALLDAGRRQELFDRHRVAEEQ